MLVTGRGVYVVLRECPKGQGGPGAYDLGALDSIGDLYAIPALSMRAVPRPSEDQKARAKKRVP